MIAQLRAGWAANSQGHFGALGIEAATSSFQPKKSGIPGFKGKKIQHPLNPILSVFYPQNSPFPFPPFPFRAFPKKRERFSREAALKWDHGWDPGIPSWSRSPESLLAEIIPSVPRIRGWDGPKCCQKREHPRDEAHPRIRNEVSVYSPSPAFPGRLSMDPSPGKPRECHKTGNGRGRGEGGIQSFKEFRKNIPGVDSEPRWRRDWEGRGWE